VLTKYNTLLDRGCTSSLGITTESSLYFLWNFDPINPVPPNIDIII